MFQTFRAWWSSSASVGLLLNSLWGLDPLWLSDGFIELNESYRQAAEGRIWPWYFWWIFALVLTGIDSTGDWSALYIHRPGSVQLPHTASPMGSALVWGHPPPPEVLRSWVFVPARALCRDEWWFVTPAWESVKNTLVFVQHAWTDLQSRGSSSSIGNFVGKIK